MSELNDHHPDPNRGTYRPGDKVPEDSVVGNSPLWHGHQAPKPKRTVRNAILIGIGALIVFMVALAALSPAPAKAPTAVTSQAGAPVDNGPTPVVTPTNKPQPSPRVTHKPAPPMTASQVGGSEFICSDSPDGRHNTVSAIGGNDEPLGYNHCGYCGTRLDW